VGKRKNFTHHLSKNKKKRDRDGGDGDGGKGKRTVTGTMLLRLSGSGGLREGKARSSWKGGKRGKERVPCLRRSTKKIKLVLLFPIKRKKKKKLCGDWGGGGWGKKQYAREGGK